MCKRFRDVKSSRTSINGSRSNGNRGNYHIQNDFDKDAIQLRNTENAKLNNLEQDIYAQRPLIPSPRPHHQQQQVSRICFKK